MKKLLTIIFDGFGIRESSIGNAIIEAKMTNFNKLFNEYPKSLLYASESRVGLKTGQVGNSEVGHSTIGAGRVLKQNEILVNEFLENVDLENTSIKKLLELKDKKIHLVGLCSDGNIHAGVDDFLHMFKFLVEQGYTQIYFHLMSDGRDSDMHSTYSYISLIENAIKEYGVGEIVSLCGRYFGMDRDENYDRTKVYYNLIVNGVGLSSLSIERSIKSNYAKNVTDEFIKPILLSKNTIKNGDVVIWMNYRADRSKQILSALVNSSFDKFPVKDLSNVTLFSFFNIDKKIKTNNFLEPAIVKQPLGIYLSELGFTQARIAEGEKFPHVTYFFDGGYDGKIPKCDKFLIPSADVATYDLLPEMSAVAVTRKVINCMENDYDFILVNYANPDMVGHTGNMEAATKACMAIDVCLGKLIERAEDNFYKVILLADHGNVDMMINEDGSKCTTHTLSKVPFILLDNKVKLKEEGDLTNVAPTILDYLDIALPKEMQDTESLLINLE
ncbi:MAG: 2,3-bisphosphoglycerate-independent phosphoglycerate mutase [Bacilli bacterium]